MKSTILHHRPPGQNVPAKPPANLPERPRGVDATTLGCAPGTSRAVVDGLMAEAAYEATERAIQAGWNRLASLLRQPLPRADWQIQQDTVLAATVTRIMQLPIGDWYRRLSRIGDETVQWVDTLTESVTIPARQLQDDLIDNMAASILAEVAAP